MRAIKRVALTLSLWSVIGTCWAFPDKLVKIIVPYPAGGATDASARIVGQKLSEIWKQPVIVENRPGAAGAIGTELAARSQPDGHTLLLQAPILLSTELHRPSVNYRTLRDFIPVTTIYTTPIVFVASFAAPKGTLREILASSRSKNQELDYGHQGDGTMGYYLGESLRRTIGDQFVSVAYNGDGPIVTDLLGGHLKTGLLSGLNAKKAADSGKVRLLAVVSNQRSPLLPEVPTFGEAGLDGFDRQAWGKIFVPTGTSMAIVEQISRDISRILAMKEVSTTFATLGLTPAGGSPAETLRDVQGEYVYWMKLIRKFGNAAK